MELIVVDGGSEDETRAIAREFTNKVLTTKWGRARQMNHGAGQATGDVLLFLHADCALPKDWTKEVEIILSDPAVAAGAFDLRLEHPSLCFRVIERTANMRSRLSCVPYGDQGMFVRASVFRQVGGFADLPLMEDIEIARRIKRVGRIRFSSVAIKALPRRWLKEGILRTTVKDGALAFAYTVLGVSPGRLAKYYPDTR